MKQAAIFFISCLTAFSATAQLGALCSVTVTINGKKNRQVFLDGKNYTNDITATGNPATFTIPDLPNGQHTLQVLRTYYSTNSGTTKSATTFTLRPAYDMLITINSNGSIELKETRKRKNENAGNDQYKDPMPDASFNILYQEVQQQWPGSAKMSALSSTFSNINNYFTTYQVRQLILLVSLESNRLQLAKSSYRSITDPASFSLLYDLLNSQASRNELAVYVSSCNCNNNEDLDDDGHPTPMTDSRFNELYQAIQQQWPGNAKMSALSSAFAESDNYFTTSQAGKLIQLVSSETNRLQSAKASYRSITDPANFSQLYVLLSSQASRNELAAYISAYNYDENRNDKGYPTPMPDSRFNELCQDVHQQWLGSAKMSALSRAFANTDNYFTTYQAGQLIQLVSSESSRLQLAKTSYRSITDPVNFSQLYDLLYNQESKNELAAYVSSYYYINNENLNNSGYPTSMTESRFNELYQDIQHQWPVSAKMNALSGAFANTNNYFTTYQVRQLIQLVSSESYRLQLAKSSYRSITDPANFSQLDDLLSSPSGRNELAAYVNAYKGTNPVRNNQNRLPVSDANFNALYSDVQQQWLPGAKMTALTNAFANTNNYFTVSQARQLIQLVSNEMNRLQLAKSSYRNIVDPANFSRMNDLFSNQANKDELVAYVHSNPR